VLSCFSQSLLKPENDSTFTAEYRNGDEWAMIAKEGFIVGVSNKLIKDDYGKFYRLQIARTAYLSALFWVQSY